MSLKHFQGVYFGSKRQGGLQCQKEEVTSVVFASDFIKDQSHYDQDKGQVEGLLRQGHKYG